MYLLSAGRLIPGLRFFYQRVPVHLFAVQAFSSGGCYFFYVIYKWICLAWSLLNMKLSKIEIGAISLISVVVITVVICMLPKGKPSNGTASDDLASSSPAVTSQKRAKQDTATNPGAVSQGNAKTGKERKGLFSRDAKAAVPVSAAAAAQGPAVPTAAQVAAQKAVENWETLVDKLVELKDAPTKERMAEVKEAFDKLDKKDQMDAVQRAVNLLPDEQFSSLYGILFDKSENAEVLDTIFSDGLNRPEDIKVPMMKELVVDKEHPMFFESARILDVTGELDKMSGKTEPGTEQNDAMQETAEGETPVGQTVPAADAKVTP
jgi:hypothetical protein